MSDAEFKRSSLAKVDALYQVQVYSWQKTRDYFPALQASLYLNRNKGKDSNKVFSADDILNHRYRRKKQAASHDPDRGAAGDWRELKASLKGKTVKQAAKRKRLRVFQPQE